MANLCSFGCGKEAIHYFKSSKNWCCSLSLNKCEQRRKHNSETKKGKDPFLGKEHPRGMLGKTQSIKGKTYDEFYGLEKALILKTNLSEKHKKIIKFPMTEATKEKIGKSMIGNKNGNHRGDRQSYYSNIRMDSSWEVKVASYLDKQNIKWSYGNNIIIIDERSSYRPDFLLDDGRYIEVKGYWRKENLKKFNKVLELYPNLIIEVWDKTVLKNKGIL